MQIGLVGLQSSGKTTVFQTLTQIHLDSSTMLKRESNQAIVKVPDGRLDKLTNIFNPKKKVNATIEIVDFVGLQKGDHVNSKVITQFISKAKTNDALIHVVRGFEDENNPHLEGSINIVRDIQLIEDEFLLTDLAFVESRFEKLEKDLMKQKNKDAINHEIEAMKKWHNALENSIPLREIEISEEDMKYIKNYQPLTYKPLLIAVNLSEDLVNKSSEIIDNVKKEIKGKNIRIEPFFAKIELELSQLPEEEKAIFMEEYGLTESPLDRMIRSAYELLGLQSFFTVGEDECRAWTIKKGMNAQEAAGTIHTDFYNKFIRAEVVSYDDFIKYGNIAKCKENGVFRLEGKEYICKDGDILNIRHN